VLLKEINHRVKYSLQLVASMLRLQARDDPQVGRRLREASSRIMAIGRAHDRLAMREWAYLPISRLIRRLAWACES
jgi:two-component sensor histidine kinase